jgi:hypothetical protein
MDEIARQRGIASAAGLADVVVGKYSENRLKAHIGK